MCLLHCAVLLAAPVPLQDTFVETRRMLPRSSIPFSGILTDGALGDVNGDGEQDALIVTDLADLLWYGAGAGRFENGSADLPPLTDAGRTGALGDLDGDGMLDAVIGNLFDPSRVLLQQGGVLVHASDVPATESWVEESALGDLDLDGDLDLFFVNTLWTPNEVFMNDGLGAFQLSAALPVNASSSHDVALVDIDGDGDLDAYVANEDGDPGSLLEPDRMFRNDGAGVFVEFPGSPFPIESHDVEFGDADGDGDLDAYVSSVNGVDRLLLGDGAGGLAIGPSIAQQAALLSRFLDLDGDGLADVLSVHTDGLRIFLAVGGGAFTETTAVSVPLNAVPGNVLLAGDVDQDLDPDLVLFGNSEPRLWLNHAGTFGAFETAPPMFPEGWVVSELAIGDVDGDGDPDVIGSTATAVENALLLNDGDGSLVDVSAQLGGFADDTLDVELADLDGDGDLDALFGNRSPFDRVLANDGSGTFAELAGAIPVTGGYTTSLAVGDVDGDGDFDHVACRATSPFGLSGMQGRVNDGSGLHTDSTGLVLTTPSGLLSPVFTDVDADGDLDLFFAAVVGTRLYENDGAGGYTEVTAAKLPALGSSRIAAGDVDLDGDPDLALAREDTDVLLANDGAGTFTPSAAWAAVDEFTVYIAMADANADGSIDLLTSTFVSPGAGHYRLYPNDGLGSFGTSELGVLGSNVAFPALADLDADGDVELLSVSGLSLRVLTNVASGQVARRTPPRIGKPLRMEVFGAPGTPWSLAASLGKASIPFAPFGTLLLDPSTLWLASAGTMPAAGVEPLDFPVPPDPTLAGLTVWWQMLGGTPLRFTNREPTALSAF